MRLLTYAAILLFTTLVTNVQAQDYNYISPERVKKNLEANIDMLIVDIQVQEEFNQHHIGGSIATYAYPVKNAAERAKLNQPLAIFQQTKKPIVIVCPRGKGGAKRSYDYFKAQGVAEEKLAILEKGMSGWPYKELIETK